MLARMCVLQVIPQAFDAYVPPKGINVAWFWDFNGKGPNQVIGFFTGTELSLDKDTIIKEGDILKEVQNNRCFQYVKTIPQSQWAATIPDFAYDDGHVSMPKDTPNMDPNWIPVAEYEAEINEEIFNELNKQNIAANMERLDTDPTKQKIKDNKKLGEPDKKTYKVNYVRFVDKIRAEK